MAATTGTWSVTCSNGGSCGANINQETGQITFPPNNTSSAITYTITYTDSQGYCGSKTMVQPSCGSSTCTDYNITGKKDGNDFRNGGTLEVGGGTITFSVNGSQPSGDCGDYKITGKKGGIDFSDGGTLEVGGGTITFSS